jgi:hypothetical protein
MRPLHRFPEGRATPDRPRAAAKHPNNSLEAENSDEVQAVCGSTSFLHNRLGVRRIGNRSMP